MELLLHTPLCQGSDELTCYGNILQRRDWSSPPFLFERCHLKCPTIVAQISSMYVCMRPFFMKRRSPLNPVSSNTLKYFSLTISLSLALLEGSLRPPWCVEDLFRPFFFGFSQLLGLFSNFSILALRELLILSPKTLSIATTVVTLPVLEFSIAISLAVKISNASLVALIGQVSVDFKLLLEGCSNLRCLSTTSQ